MNKTHELHRKLQRHFLVCSTLPGAALLLSGQQAAEAAVTLVTPGAPVSVPATIDGVYLNLETQAIGGTGGTTPGWDINPFSNGGNLQWFTNASVGAGNAIASSAVTGGTVQSVPAGTDFTTLTYDPQTYNIGSSPAILAGGTHFVAMQFVDGAAVVNNAWIQITTSATTGFPATINQWAFAPVGESFVVGQTVTVPEPALSALSLLAVGALGLRRRRAA